MQSSFLLPLAPQTLTFNSPTPGPSSPALGIFFWFLELVHISKTPDVSLQTPVYIWNFFSFLRSLETKLDCISTVCHLGSNGYRTDFLSEACGMIWWFLNDWKKGNKTNISSDYYLTIMWEATKAYLSLITWTYCLWYIQSFRSISSEMPSPDCWWESKIL